MERRGTKFSSLVLRMRKKCRGWAKNEKQRVKTTNTILLLMFDSCCIVCGEGYKL